MGLSSHQIGEMQSLSLAFDLMLLIFVGIAMGRFEHKATTMPGLIGIVAALVLVSFAGFSRVDGYFRAVWTCCLDHCLFIGAEELAIEKDDGI